MEKLKKLLYNKYFFTLLIIPFLQPLIVNTMESIDKVFLIFKMIFAVIIFIMFVARNKFSKLIFAVAAYCILLAISTILNSGEIIRCLSYIIPIASLVMLVDMWMDIDSKSFFRHISIIFSLYIIINLISVIYSNMKYPEWYLKYMMDKHYFLGEDNRFVFVMLPLLCFFAIDPVFGKKRIIKYLIYLICSFTLIYVWSVAAMVGILLFGILYYLFVVKKIKIKKIFNEITVFGFILVSNISLIIFKVYNLLAPIFENLFNKKATLESRYMLWEKGSDYIIQSPIFGYGIESLEVLKNKFVVTHTHNTFLQLTYESGFLGLLIFFIILFIIFKSLKRCTNDKIKYISLISIFIMFLLGLFDSLSHAYFFLMLYSIYKISEATGLEKLGD